MANPIDTLTKPLQVGAKIAFGAVQGIQHALGGSRDEEPQPQPQQDEAPRQPQRRNTKPKSLDDATITRKVETELFRDERIDKGKISVDTADGVVHLRGEAKTPELIKELVAKVEAIPEVKEVENVLHLPKTPARKPKTKSTRQTARKVTPKRVTSERTPSVAEPSPKEVAAKGQGRQPAPLGSSDNGSGGPGAT